MRKSLRLGGTLLAITGITGLILGVAYVVTKEPIMKSQMRERDNAMRAALPSGETFKKVDMKTAGSVVEVSQGFKGEDLVGYDLRLATKGYGGDLELIVGLSKDGAVEGIRIMKHSETPGLGANATKPAFSDQFIGKSSKLSVVKVSPKGDEIQALSGATITSRAVTDAVNEAISFYEENLKEAVR